MKTPNFFSEYNLEPSDIYPGIHLAFCGLAYIHIKRSYMLPYRHVSENNKKNAPDIPKHPK